MLVPVYDARGRVVAMSQVPDNFPPTVVSAGYPEREGRGMLQLPENLQSVLEDNKTEYYWGKLSKDMMKRMVTLQRKSYPQMMKGKNN